MKTQKEIIDRHEQLVSNGSYERAEQLIFIYEKIQSSGYSWMQHNRRYVENQMDYRHTNQEDLTYLSELKWVMGVNNSEPINGDTRHG